MVFRRRLRRAPKQAGVVRTPDIARARNTETDTPSSLSLESADHLPLPLPKRVFLGGGSGSTVTRGTGDRDKPPPMNTLPPGMPEMPSTPPTYARLGERRVSEIDNGIPASRTSGSINSKDSRSSRTRRRFQRVFGRVPRHATGSHAPSTGSSVLDDVPTEEERRRTTSFSVDKVGGKLRNTANREMFFFAPAATLASTARADYGYDEKYLRDEIPNSRLKLCDLSTKGRFVRIAEDVTEAVRVHDNYVSFVVPHGWIATRTQWGFYLSCRESLGFIMATSAKEATKHLIDAQKMSVLSEVRVMSSPVFESRHRAVVKYAAHDLEGRGCAQFDIGFHPGATVFGLCAPRSMQDHLNRVEERLAASAVVLNVPDLVDVEKVKSKLKTGRYESSSIYRLATGTNCVMQ